MKHAGKAGQAGRRLIILSLVVLLVFIVGGALAAVVGSVIVAAATTFIVLWILFAVFCINFFRDPEPITPQDPTAIVAPGHGKVDVIDETTEAEFLGGPCRRVSIFLSVFDIHVQNAPVAGRIAYLKHCPGKFLNAMRTDCSSQNENVLIGFDSAEAPGEKISVRLIAGLLARRIVPWVAVADETKRGERISLIQFGSRVDIYMPLSCTIAVRLGDRVKGGETVIANRAT
jgi:phosphatidylserine decarboxylase